MGSQSALSSGPTSLRARPWPGVPCRAPGTEVASPAAHLPASTSLGPKGFMRGHLAQACPRASAGVRPTLVVTVSYLTESRGTCPSGQVEAAVNRTSQTDLKQAFTPQSPRGTAGSGSGSGRPLPGLSSQPFWGCTR